MAHTYQDSTIPNAVGVQFSKRIQMTHKTTHQQQQKNVRKSKMSTFSSGFWQNDEVRN